MAVKYISGTCPKCDGKGHIIGFSHIVNGVCFRCGGTGTCKVRAEAKPAPELTDYQKRYLRIITEGDLSQYTYGQLLSLRNFAHCPVAGYPELHKTWIERGEAYFQAAQAERLAAMVAENHPSTRFSHTA